jgi:hypothetical protein
MLPGALGEGNFVLVVSEGSFGGKPAGAPFRRD